MAPVCIKSVHIKKAKKMHLIAARNKQYRRKYMLNSSIGTASISIILEDGSDPSTGNTLGPGLLMFQSDFQQRFRGNIMERRFELKIFSVNTLDDQTYKFTVFPTGDGPISDKIILDVNCKYSLKYCWCSVVKHNDYYYYRVHNNSSLLLP